MTKPRRRARAAQSAAEAVPADSWPRRGVTASLLAGAAVLFLALQWGSIRAAAATWDEGGNVLAGYAALSHGDYRPAIEHPPLARLWAALPLVFSGGVRFDSSKLDAQPPEAVAFPGPFEAGHDFLFRDNDAERLLLPARLQIALLGLLLGGLIVAWAGECLGFRGATIALVLFLLEPTLAAHSGFVTTDLPVTVFMFGAMYALWRCARQFSLGNAAAVVACATAALVTKFSALLLVPMMLAAIVLGRRGGNGVLSWRRAGLLFAIVVATTWAGVWAIYGFRYLPSPTAGWQFAFQHYPPVRDAVPMLATITGWIDDHHLLPNAYTQGFLHGQGLIQTRTAFLFGDYSDTGWWYYFPVAFALKAPTPWLVLLIYGGVCLIRKTTSFASGGAVFVVVPALIFLGAAMTSSYNVGVRHLLPIYPFAIVLAAAGGARLWQASRRGGVVLAVLAVIAAGEYARAYPAPVAFFNTIAGGPPAGFRSLADSNLDWGQGLKPLGHWMTDYGVGHINLAYYGTAEPRYYGVNATLIWGTTIPGVAPSTLGPPLLPGYVAVSTTLLDGVPFAPGTRDFYKPLREATPVADIGGSIKIYRVERPWWPGG